MDTRIWITTQFEGIHAWPDAPEEVSFLSCPHRHMFHVKVEVSVTHDDREIEFILFKRWLDGVLSERYDEMAKSCEMMAKEIIELVREEWGDRSIVVEVSEDGENGARVEDLK